VITLLKNNLILSPFFLAVLAFILRIAGILNPQMHVLKESDGFLYSLLHNLIPYPIGQSILCTVLIIFQAIWINKIVIEHRLIENANYLTAFLYIIFMSLVPDFLGLHPFIVGNTFFVLAVGEIASTYKKVKVSGTVFNIGLLVSISSLIYFPFAIFYFFASLALMVIRSYNILERVQLFFGFIAPYYALAMILFWRGELSAFFSDYVWANIYFPRGLFSLDKSYVITLSIALLIVVFSLFSYGAMIRKKGIQIEKITDILYWIFIFSFFGIFFWKDLSIYHYLILAFPASIVLANNIFLIKNLALAEILGLTLVLGVFAIHFILI